MRGGKTMPVRLYHKLAFGADGAPGASRTLVISRARDEHSDPERAAEVRFMRFFDHTPMAIATVDRAGIVVRSNARYAKLAQSLTADGAAAQSIFLAVNAHKPTDPPFQDIMKIKQNATRAATLVRQLLAFSRRQTLRPQVLDLGDALSDLTMLLRRLIGEKVKLDLVHGRDLWPVKVDVSQFEQVIVNLAVNARDARPDGGAAPSRRSRARQPLPMARPRRRRRQNPGPI